MLRIKEKYWTIPLFYLLIGALWILISDGVVFLEYTQNYSPMQTVKGLFFVLITAFLLHILLRIYYQRLERSEREYRFFFEENPGPYYVINSDNGRILALNRAAEELYGYSREQLLGLPEKKLEIRVELQSSERKGFGERIALHKKSGGTTFYVKLFTKPSLFKGAPASIVMVTNFDKEYKDQLELKETRSVSESQQKYLQSLADSTRLFLLRFLEDGTLLYANSWFQQWLRTVSKKENPDSLFDPLSEQSIAAIKQHLEKCRNNPGKLFTLTMEEPDGKGGMTYIDWEFNGISNPSGKVHEFQALGTEVTEKVVSLKENAIFKVRMESILKSIDGVIFALDISTMQVNFVSPSIEKLLGQPFHTYLENPAAWSDTIFEEDKASVFEVMNELLSGQPGSTAGGEYRVVDAQGNLKWVSNKAVYVLDPILKTPMVSGIITDITHLKEAETAISDRNEKLREIARIQSHALRGPLSSILGLIQLFDREHPASHLNQEVITHLETKSKELDMIIHDIVKKAWELEKEHAEPVNDLEGRE